MERGLGGMVGSRERRLAATGIQLKRERIGATTAPGEERRAR